VRQAVLPYPTLIDKILGTAWIATVSTGIWDAPHELHHRTLAKTLRAELLDRTLI
jgi:hypothetical protein